MNQNLVVMFAKKPESGKVKTRLAAGVGNESAVKIYEQVLHGLVSVLKPASGFDLKLYVKGDQDYFTKNFEGLAIDQQAEGDLGNRLFGMFKKEFESYERIIVIGSDCPDIGVDFLERSFEQLKHNNAVIGPATDGGYYLLGLSLLVNLFEDIAWSTSTVFDETMKKIIAQKLTCVILEEKNDIDTVEDYEDYKSRGFLD